LISDLCLVDEIAKAMNETSKELDAELTTVINLNITTTTTTMTTTSTEKPTTTALPPLKAQTRKAKVMSLTTPEKPQSVSTTSSTTISQPNTTQLVTTKAQQNDIAVMVTERVQVQQEDQEEADYESELSELKTTKLQPDQVSNERLMGAHGNESEITASFVIKAAIIALLTVCFTVLVALIVIKQYRRSTNPLNYKDKQCRSSSERADEEFSEIKYLTCDETLDFQMATPEIANNL